MTNRKYIALSILIFVIFAITIKPLRMLLGDDSNAYPLAPAIMMTWIFGLPTGLLAAIGAAGLQVHIIAMSESTHLSNVMNTGGWTGFVAMIVVTFIVSYFRRVHKKQQNELIERSIAEKELRRSEELLLRTFDQLPISSAIVTLDFRHRRVNRAFCDMLGYQEEEIKQICFTDLIHPADFKFQLSLLTKLKANELSHIEIDNRYLHKTGKIVWVRLLVRMVRNHAGESIYYLPMMVDITEWKQAEAALEKESSIHAALADLSHSLILGTSVSDMPSLVVNHAIRLTDSEMGYVGFIDPKTGFLVSSNQCLEVWEKCRMSDKTLVFSEFRGLWGWVLKNKKPIIANNPQQDERSSGVPEGHIPLRRFLSVPAIISGTLVGQIAVANAQRDYSEEDLSILERLATLYGAAVYQQQLRDQYLFLSLHDPLTGLYNRRFIEEVISQLKNSNQYPISAIFGDLDRLKEVNDRRGHNFGDTVIQCAGDILRSSFRSDDIIARIGGDEFVILLPNTSAAAADEVIQRLRQNLDQHNQVSDSLRVFMSFGTATADNRFELEDLIKQADAAMYLDKLARVANRNSASMMTLSR